MAMAINGRHEERGLSWADDTKAISVDKGQLIEAADAATTEQRIREIYHEYPDCREILAANPGCPWDMINELADRFPRQVLSNPLIEALTGLETLEQLRLFDLRAVMALVVADGDNTPPCLVEILRQQLHQACDDVNGKEIDIVKTETWSYERWGVEAGPPFDISLDITLEVDLQGDGGFAIDSTLIDSIANRDQPSLTKLLDCLCHASVDDIFGDSHDRPEDIVVKDELETRIEISSLSDGIDIEGTSVLLAGTQRELFRVNAFYMCSNGEDPVALEAGVLTVPVSEHSDSSSHMPELQDTSQLGALEQLWGWSPTIFSPKTNAENWTERIASLLLQSE